MYACFIKGSASSESKTYGIRNLISFTVEKLNADIQGVSKNTELLQCIVIIEMNQKLSINKWLIYCMLLRGATEGSFLIMSFCMHRYSQSSSNKFSVNVLLVEVKI